MKELSIEEKAQRYNRAFIKSREFLTLCEKCGAKDTIEFIEDIFPELAELDDKKIRKEIIDYIDKATGCKRWVAWLEKQEDKDSQVKLPTFTFDDILALQCCMETVKKVQEDKDLYEKLNDLHGRVYDAYHLEKQGEQKPVDKIEPKFKVGDWVIDKQGIVHQIANVVKMVANHTYGYDIVGGGYFNDTVEGVRLWNISDAKEGDVLVDSLGNVCIYQEPSTKLMYHSHCYGNHKFFIPMGGSHEIVGSYPATKEQRDQLEKAMTDAGYAFDFDKKELKKIEHKPTWSDEDV